MVGTRHHAADMYAMLETKDAVRPSLVPMRDLVHTIDGARVDSGTGRTGARREDGAWDLGNGQ